MWGARSVAPVGPLVPVGAVLTTGSWRQSVATSLEVSYALRSSAGTWHADHDLVNDCHVEACSVDPQLREPASAIVFRIPGKCCAVTWSPY